MMLFFTMPAMKIIVKKLRMVTTIVILTMMMMRLNGKNIDKDVGIDEDEEDDGNGRS